MNEPGDWGRLFGADAAGLEELTGLISAHLADLRLDAGPRRGLDPAALREIARDIEVCPEDGTDATTIAQRFARDVWANGVVPLDPFCVAHLHPPTLNAAVAAEVAIGATNQSMDSWDQAPLATELELHLMDFLAVTLGLPTGATGVMTSGGTASNVLGVTLARSRAAAKEGVDVLREGLPASARDWRIVASDQAHFSLQRAAAQLGLGRDAVVVVESDARGRMDVAALSRTLEDLADEGRRVICVAGTAGTTDLGAIDPLAEIAALARAHDAWFHVDAAVAGAFALSSHLAPRLAGIDEADSVTVDFHKLWWQPFNASALMVRDETSFDHLRVRSDYLDRGDELEGVVNLVGRSLDTSRRFDAAKVVASLATLGRRRAAAMLDHLVASATYCAELIEAREDLDLLTTPEGVTCLFDAPDADEDALRRVQQSLLAEGLAVLGRTRIKGRAALKFTFMNPLVTPGDVEALVELVARRLDEVRGTLST